LHGTLHWQLEWHASRFPSRRIPELGQCVQKQLPAKGGDRLYQKSDRHDLILSEPALGE